MNYIKKFQGPINDLEKSIKGSTDTERPVRYNRTPDCIYAEAKDYLDSIFEREEDRR